MTLEQQKGKFGEAVRQERDQRGWTRQRIGDELGLSETTVAKWEKGGGANEEHVVKLEQLFGLKPGALGWYLGHADPPDMGSPEAAIRVDAGLSPGVRRAFLVLFGEVRRSTAGEP